ncbi:hypothetical protein PZN02_001903 [Sinorhizobium garamanticum]|uniref:Uncharacterized protein n=1 Tax=Sinorhizobium garamanticum TaxID=680247 RepID=A0ABY8DII5_9HYPH|nr:hypothetical protein [Sinorhizobium garamanticum]WEX89335.1 hypothetical protein PZN02_001903 [Sinorhizobium garamanticum]
MVNVSERSRESDAFSWKVNRRLTTVPHIDCTQADLLPSARTIGLAADVEGRDEKLGWPIDSL